MTPLDWSRRSFLAAAAAAAALPALGVRAAAEDPAVRRRFADIQRRIGGRVGVAVLDGGSGRLIAGFRADERFPMCSTFKFLLVAQVLARADAGQERLDRMVAYGKDDLLEYAPVAARHLGQGGMSVAALCEAAICYSDNTAANLLLATVGGPAGLTAYMRSIGDRVSRLDRIEPELNSALPDDPRDTTEPAAMALNLQTILLRDALAPASRDQLQSWLTSNTTGNARLRAGLPGSWRVGDKTGTGRNGATNDIAIVWPPGRAPILVAAYAVGSSASAADRNAALAEVGRCIAGLL